MAGNQIMEAGKPDLILNYLVVYLWLIIVE